MNRYNSVLGFSLAALICVGTLSACGEEEEGGPLMKPGEPCLSCHTSGGKASEERFTAAGTIFSDGSGGSGLAGATITITGADSSQVTMTSNAAGNFFTEQSIAKPYTVMVTTETGSATMMSTATSGDCNGCHRSGGLAGSHIHP